LEGTFKVHVDQAPCSEQRHLQLGQVAQSLIQPDLECFQGWGIYNQQATVWQKGSMGWFVSQLLLSPRELVQRSRVGNSAEGWERDPMQSTD